MNQSDNHAPLTVLVFNCGSSSIKYQLYRMPQREMLARGVVERIGEPQAMLKHEYSLPERHGSHEETEAIDTHQAGVALILKTLVNPAVGALADIAEIGAIGHRVVHGGDEFTGSVVIDEDVIDTIERFADLAPLHNPPNLTGIRAAQANLPNIPQVACFDTAFHQTLPEVAYIYPLPYDLYEKNRVRRYGFHGTSHRWVARRAARVLGMGKYDINCVTCHLGNGCSIAAVKQGRSVDTSMGLTPLEGMVMGTRCGDVDPGILFYLGGKGYDVKQLNALCNKESGLLGISGESNDMRTLTELAEKGHERAQLAIDIFCYRIKKYVGAYTAVVGQLDALVFTGGIGENATQIRAQVCNNLEQIGIEIDSATNAATHGTEADISSADSRAHVLVIPTNEEAAIAGDTYELASQHIGETCAK